MTVDSTDGSGVVGSKRDTVNRLLAQGPHRETFDQLIPHVYAELRQIARRQLRGDWRRQTLDTTSLVNEAYLQLVDEDQLPLRCRAYFFAAAAHSMRRILSHAARRRSSLKRGGDRRRVDLDETALEVEGFAAEILDLESALEKLEAEHPRQAQVVECRFYGGLSVEETAEALDLSARTVKRDWSFARAWLQRELDRSRATASGAPTGSTTGPSPPSVMAPEGSESHR